MAVSGSVATCPEWVAALQKEHTAVPRSFVAFVPFSLFVRYLLLPGGSLNTGGTASSTVYR